VADLSAALADVVPRLKAAPLYAPAQRAGLDNPAWEGAPVRFLVVRLSPFRDAARSTGHLFLHRMIRAADGTGPRSYVDFAFFPSKPDRAALDGAALPWLSGISSGRTAEDFDAVLVSCSYALELVNLPLFLLRSGIPLRASVRNTSSPAYPPIILGGSNALASQALIFPDGDSFVDGIFFGEGEDGGAELVSILARTAGKPTAERTEALEREVGAFWAACRGAPEGPRSDGRVRIVRPGRCALSDSPLLLDSYPLLNSEEASTARLQLSWGCPAFCSFCFEGWERKPYRELPLQRILETARKLKRESGASAVDLYSFNFNAHQDALDLMLELNRIFDRVNMMSQRADLLARTPGMLSCELAAEKRSYTVGVEGISAGMRAYYAKDLAVADLRSLMEKLLAEKVRELKLFYILSGLETEADLAEFRSFCTELRVIAESRHPGLRALFSFGYLVRMPFTPLRAEALVLDRKAFDPIVEAAKAAVESQGFEFRLASDWNEYVADQFLVSGGYALAEALEGAAGAGCAFDLRIEGDLVPRLARALKETGALSGGTEGKPYSGPLTEPKGTGYRYPLSFVETSVADGFRSRAFEDARARRSWRSCLGDNGGSCLGCTACGDAGERDFITSHRVKGTAGTALAERIAAQIREKRRALPRHVLVRLPEILAGAEEEFLRAWLLRETLRGAPELGESLFRIEEALRNSAEWRDRLPVPATGEAVLALYGGPELDVGRAAVALGEALGSPAEVLGAFAPADVAGMTAEIDLPGGPVEAGARVRKWLSSLRLAATERKTPDGRAFDIAPKDRKKRIVETLRLSGGRVIVAGGAKLDLAPLLAKPEDRASARIRIVDLRIEERP
jgi:radical SAM superfamily enzyme YgiQ (UPF0313 family)